MKNITEFLKDILRQIFGLTKPREGKIILTRRATDLMLENGLYPELIRDTFKYGIETRTEVIVKKYPKYKIGVYYKYDGVEDVYRITFLFKN